MDFKRSVWLILPASATLAVAGTLVVGVSAFENADSPAVTTTLAAPPNMDWDLEILRQPATELDTLPATDLLTPLADLISSPADVRLALADPDGTRLFIVPGRETGNYCLIAVESSGAGATETSATCSPPVGDSTEAVVMSYSSRLGYRVAGIVGNSVDRVGSAEAGHNAFLTTVTRDTQEFTAYADGRVQGFISVPTGASPNEETSGG